MGYFEQFQNTKLSWLQFFAINYIFLTPLEAYVTGFSLLQASFYQK